MTSDVEQQDVEPITAEDVSVLICAFDEARLPITDESITALLGQTTPPGEIIVVIDHNPALFARARDRWPGVRVIESPGPRGSSTARNAAVAASTGTVIAYLDDDAAPAPDWVEAQVRAYRDPTVCGVGGSVLPRWETRRPRWLPQEFDWVIGCSYTGLPAGSGDVRNFIGASMSFRRWAFDTAGGFDPAFSRVGRRPLGIDDTELCIRMGRRLPAFRLRHDEAMVAWHHVPAHRTTISYFVTRCRFEGMSKALLRRVPGGRDALGVERRYALGVLPRGVVTHLASVVARRDPMGAARAAAIALGGVATAVGYLEGLVSPQLRRHVATLRDGSA